MILIDWLLKVMRAVAEIATGSKRRRLKAPRADLEEGALLVEESAEQLRNLERAYAKLEEQYKALEEAKRAVEVELDRTLEAKDAAEARVRGEKKAREDAEVEVVRWRKSAEQAGRELKHVRTAKDQLEALFNTKTAELREAQAFLTKGDAVSDADVQRMVEKLNAEIYQLSASLTEAVVSWGGPADGEHLRASYERVLELIGAPIVHYMRAAAADGDCIWIQLGLQALLVVYASWLASRWHPGLEPAQHDILARLHASLFKNEPQSVSARWRALASRHICKLFVEEERYTLVLKNILHDVEAILLLAGAQDVLHTSGWVAQRFQARVQDVVVQAIAIQKTITQDIISSDFRIICPHSGSVFASEAMQDVDDCGRSRKRENSDGRKILCATELGLLRHERLSEEDGIPAETLERVVIKAKVALEGVS
ncbi:hypothetical protein PsYK624_122230 [Phanerochaete sordida]|uniref:Uncharacterized protein n=1 Tax=Phanerochaete sordida TaxID=48140 RepID=A0A9P3GM57_9APHY|nr:hypothetical protein PsYK624_122230 [Phanerochaete sordida]